MKQYEYQMFNKKNGRLEHVRATAKTEEIARLQIMLTYGNQFDVMDGYSNINPPHKIFGEIDCSDFPDADLDWLRSKANA
jgi:hypothetical protein